ncbi:MAG: molybdopterin-dependent oxidoreductase [Eggerthellaceae bacterium]|nr:molybdopterin-dependent oxidoreductase [Eggerthellaceae bacterium]
MPEEVHATESIGQNAGLGMSASTKQVPMQDDPGAATRKDVWEEDGFTVVRGNARTAPGCHDNCGILMYIDKDGKLDHVEGDPDDPYNQGRLCLRCLTLPDVIYHKDRQLYPMKRDRADRGKDKWERITWEEAYEICERELKAVQEKYGPQAIQVFCGTGRDIVGYHPMLANILDTPNQGMGFLSGQGCYVPRMFSTTMKMGNLYTGDYSQNWIDRYDNPNWVRPDYVVIWGNNPVVANSDGTLGHWIVECMKRGTKLITIDPKLTWCAAHSEYWLQVRPGTDSALALAFGHVIVNEDLYDHEFVDCWCYGFDEYVKNVQEWTPARAAEICQIDEDLIWSAARALGNADGWSLQWGVALDHTAEGFYSGASCYDLCALCGQFDKPGGMVCGKPSFGVPVTWIGSDTDWIPTTRNQYEHLHGDYPALKVIGMPSPDATLEALEGKYDYPVKAAWLQTNNCLSNMGAQPQRIAKGLMEDDFNVVMDLWMTPTAMAVADVFLPVTTFAERYGLTGHQPYRTGAINKAIEKVGECRSDPQVVVEMGRIFKGADLFPWSDGENFDEEAFYDYLLRNSGFTWDELKSRTWAYPEMRYYRYKTGEIRDDGEPGFSTPTGRYEFYSVNLEAMGMRPLAFYEEPPESPVSRPDLVEKYPLTLTTGARQWGFFHSEGRQIPHLRAIHPEPEVAINPEDAAKYGIADGDWVVIENQYGSCKQKAKLDIRLKEGVVSADHGWWFPERDREDGFFGTFESNINNCIPMRPGSTGLGCSYKSVLCSIRKA